MWHDYSLDDAIRRMTIMPARQLQLPRKGHLAVGADADIVVFDPNAVLDRSTFSEPLLPPAGIEWVLIGGRPVLRDGIILDRCAGRSVRG